MGILRYMYIKLKPQLVPSFEFYNRITYINMFLARSRHIFKILEGLTFLSLIVIIIILTYLFYIEKYGDKNGNNGNAEIVTPVPQSPPLNNQGYDIFNMLF